MRISKGALRRANKPAPLQADTSRREVRREPHNALVKARRLRLAGRVRDGRWNGNTTEG